MIKRCGKCANWDRVPSAQYQDEKYGKGNRVFNRGAKTKIPGNNSNKKKEGA